MTMSTATDVQIQIFLPPKKRYRLINLLPGSMDIDTDC